MAKRYKKNDRVKSRERRALASSAPARCDSSWDAANTPVADQDSPEKLSRGQQIFGHALMIIFLFGFPAFVTTMAPLTVTDFRRTTDGVVSAHANTRLLFVIPFRRASVEGVTAVSDRSDAGSVSRTRSGGSRRDVQSEDSAFLVIDGASGSAEVEVSPVNVRSALAKAQRFLDDPNHHHLRLRTVAKW